MSESEHEFNEPEGSSIHILSIVRMVWKQARLVALVTVLLSVLVVFGVLQLPLVYRAETTILVDSQKIPEKFVSATVESSLQDRVASLSQQILSSTRLLRIIEEHNLYMKERAKLSRDELIARMRQDIGITIEKGFRPDRPGAFKVSFLGPDPQVIAAVVNQLGTHFVEENFRNREVQAEGTTDFLRSQLDQAKQSLDAQEARVSVYKLRHNGELPQQEKALMASLDQLRVQLQGHQDAISRAHQNRVTAQSALDAAVAHQETLSRLERSAVRAAATAGGGSRIVPQAKRARPSEILEGELAALQQRLREGHPDIQDLKARIAVQKKIEQEQESAELKQLAVIEAASQPDRQLPPVPSGTSPEHAQQLAALRAQLSVLDQEIDNRQSEVDRLTRELRSVEGRLQVLPVREQEMSALTRDYETSKANYQSLLDKAFASEMAAEMERRQQSERFTILDLAHVPEKPVKPNRRVLAAGGCLASLLFALFLGIGRELRNGKVLGEWEFDDEHPILGRVPAIDQSTGSV
ncbi:MAG: hypothetical protein IPM24_22030 [Bryobacterales bacterium]|nr:hypothetical protein [Bryobacterales bacterium]